MAGRLGVFRVGPLDWMADSPDQYLKKAIGFANDPAKLSPLRANLRTQALASPLFNAKNFAADFTEAMQAMHQANS